MQFKIMKKVKSINNLFINGYYNLQLKRVSRH